MLDQFRKRGEAALSPLADRLAAGGADRLTWASLVVAGAAGVSFTYATPREPLFLVLGALLVLANALLDALDGMVARKTGSASPAGDFLDHSLDRYADLFIIGGLAASAFGDFRWGFFAITGVFLTSYMGTQAEAVGLRRDYGGLLGRADRLILLTIVPLLTALLVYAHASFFVELQLPWRPEGAQMEVITLVDGLLIFFAVLGHLTALQRFVRGRLALLEREGRVAGARNSKGAGEESDRTSRNPRGPTSAEEPGAPGSK